MRRIGIIGEWLSALSAAAIIITVGYTVYQLHDARRPTHAYMPEMEVDLLERSLAACGIWAGVALLGAILGIVLIMRPKRRECRNTEQEKANQNIHGTSGGRA